MKRFCMLFLIGIMTASLAEAQQIMYSNLKHLAEGRGDTVTILHIQKRTKNQIYLMGGADYHISADDNASLGRYIKRRCYAIQIDTALYVNCRKMRYKNYRFGNWYAPAMRIGDKVYYSAQPLGQAATSSSIPDDATKLGGKVGDAILASGLADVRVYYELDLSTGKSDFVSRERMLQLLSGHPDLKAAYEQENSEQADVVGRYLRQLLK